MAANRRRRARKNIEAPDARVRAEIRPILKGSRAFAPARSRLNPRPTSEGTEPRGSRRGIHVRKLRDQED